MDNLQPCECATALCGALRTALGEPDRQRMGELWQRCERDALEGLLHSDNVVPPKPPHISDDVLSVCISAGGEQLLFMRLAGGHWGLVANYTPTAAGRLRCLLCSKWHCPHTSALKASEGGRKARMYRAASLR